jgi:hypothetical protein
VWLFVNSTRAPGGTTTSVGETEPFAPIVMRYVAAGGLGPVGDPSLPPHPATTSDAANVTNAFPVLKT